MPTSEEIRQMAMKLDEAPASRGWGAEVMHEAVAMLRQIADEREAADKFDLDGFEYQPPKKRVIGHVVLIKDDET